MSNVIVLLRNRCIVRRSQCGVLRCLMSEGQKGHLPINLPRWGSMLSGTYGPWHLQGRQFGIRPVSQKHLGTLCSFFLSIICTIFSYAYFDFLLFLSSSFFVCIFRLYEGCQKSSWTPMVKASNEPNFDIHY